MRKRKGVATALANTDRSNRDFALAACCVEYGLTNPTEIGQITFSLSPEKLLEKEAQGYGETYAAGTIQRALERTNPKARAEDWLDAAPAAPADPRSLRRRSGRVGKNR